MTATNFARALAFVIGPSAHAPLGEEGGFSNNPADPGGATYRGVTLATFRDFFEKPHATVRDLLAITDAQLSDLYHTAFWDRVRADEMPPGVDLLVFDQAVTSGWQNSVYLLQRALGVTVDGDLGPVTRAAAAAASPATLIGSLGDEQDRFYHEARGFRTFGAGWLARLDRRVALAHQLVSAGQVAS